MDKFQMKPPEALFALRPAQGTAPLTVTCDGSLSYDEDGVIVEYRWSFGDGEWAVGQVVEHRYWYGGGYPVNLTVIDEAGQQATTTQVIEIQGGPGCYTP